MNNHTMQNIYIKEKERSKMETYVLKSLKMPRVGAF